MSAENKQKDDEQVVNMANLRGGIEYASQWTLMWRRFRKHKLAVVSMVVVILFYAVAVFSEFLAPMDPEAAASRKTQHPPQLFELHFFDEGKFAPYVPGYTKKLDMETSKISFTPDGSKQHLGLFVRGFEYKMFGFDALQSDLHLFGPKDKEGQVFLFGSDTMGRDVLSRVIYGARFTLSLGLIGVILSVVLGIILGGLAGYYGGWTDWVVMRVVEFILSLPSIPIWLAMAAALPKDWPPHYQYMAVTVIISLIGWTHLARVIRGRFLSMRSDVFVIAAKLDGCSEPRIIFRHMLPSLASHIIAQVTLSIPSMVLSETSLSFLGLGLQPPAISWGVLLKGAQKISVIAQAPWLFLPGLMVVVAVLALNFFGDGLRDAADPYSNH
jgi:peptide/nickel transport system permease protein